MNNFSIARIPRIEFGAGVFSKTADICAQYGTKILVITGANSFRNNSNSARLQSDFKRLRVKPVYFPVTGEPSPQIVDEVVAQFSGHGFDVVLGIGGGSALDAAKAIAGLLKGKQSVMDYLEGVGPELSYQGPAVPFIAVPTTAGTGSEATKNAVLSVQGNDGFKKSFRDDKLVAEYAIVDPSFLSSCPKSVIAANGMDALTQLLESFVSARSNPLSDTLAISGLGMIKDSLLSLYQQRNENRAAMEMMAYASLLSGICLAQTGLGSVHGLASPLGAFYPVPHGVVCGTLVAEATKVNIKALLSREPNHSALKKYAILGDVLCGKQGSSQDESRENLCALLDKWTERLDLQTLSSYGLSGKGIDHVVANCRGGSMKTNPIILNDSEIRGLLIARL